MMPENAYPLASLIETSDLSGAAKLFLIPEDITTLNNLPPDLAIDSNLLGSVITADKLNFNYILDTINYALIEHARLEPHLGDQFSHYFFGNSPLVLNVTGKVFMTEGGFDKYALTTAYRDVFRLYQVSRLQISPCLTFKNTMTQGAMLSLNIQESSAQEDILNISFEWLVHNAYITDNEGSKAGLTIINWTLETAGANPGGT